jgi:hypothetical protein
MQVQLTFTLNANAPLGWITNTAYAKSNEDSTTDPSTDNVASVDFQALDPDMYITASGPNTVIAGTSNVCWALTYGNYGTANGSNVHVWTVVPAGVTITSISGSNGETWTYGPSGTGTAIAGNGSPIVVAAGNKIIVSRPSVSPPNTDSAITMCGTVASDAPTPINFRAYVDATGDLSTDPASNNTSAVTTTVSYAPPSLDIAVNTGSGGGYIQPGGIAQLVYTVNKVGTPQSSQQWAFSNDLPAGLVIAPDPHISTSCTSTGNNPASVTVTAAAGSGTINASGLLAVADASCTVKLDVILVAPVSPEVLAASPLSIGMDLATATLCDGNGGDTNLGTCGFAVGTPQGQLTIEQPQLKVDVAPPAISAVGASGAKLTYVITALNTANAAANRVVVAVPVGTGLLPTTGTALGDLAALNGSASAVDGRPLTAGFFDIASIAPDGSLAPAPTACDGPGVTVCVLYIEEMPAGVAYQFTLEAVIQNAALVTNDAGGYDLTNRDLWDTSYNPNLPWTVTATINSRGADTKPTCAYDAHDGQGGVGSGAACIAYDDPAGPIASASLDSDQWDQERTIAPQPSIALSKVADTDAIYNFATPVIYTITAINTSLAGFDQVTILDEHSSWGSEVQLECSGYVNGNQISPVTASTGTEVVCTGAHTPSTSLDQPPDLTNTATFTGTPYLLAGTVGAGYSTTGGNAGSWGGLSAPDASYLYPQEVTENVGVSLPILVPGYLDPIHQLPFAGSKRGFDMAGFLGITMLVMAVGGAVIMMTTRRLRDEALTAAASAGGQAGGGGVAVADMAPVAPAASAVSAMAVSPVEPVTSPDLPDRPPEQPRRGRHFA